MSATSITRRALVAGAGAPPAFDAAAYVRDLEAIGCRLAVWQPVRAGKKPGTWSYSIGSPKGRGFGKAHLDVMRRWDAAIEGCSDHAERVATFLRERDGAGV